MHLKQFEVRIAFLFQVFTAPAQWDGYFEGNFPVFCTAVMLFLPSCPAKGEWVSNRFSSALRGSFATEHLSSTGYGSSVRHLKDLPGGYYSNHVPAHTPSRPPCTAGHPLLSPWRGGCQAKSSGRLLGTWVPSTALQRCHTSKSHCKLQSCSHGFLWDSHHSMVRVFKTESTASPRKPFTAFEPQAEVFHTKSYNKHGGGTLGN